MTRPRPLNPRQLEAFRAVMLTGSMTRGGQFMSISQPAVTRLIQDLEHDLKLALFRRSGAQLVPTTEGQQLYREVERHFAGTERIREVAQAIREARAGHLNLGAMPNLAASCLPQAVSRFLKESPGVVVSIHPEDSISLLDMVVHDQLDVAFAVVPQDRADLDHEPFPATRAVCIMPKGHRLAKKSRVAVADLVDEDFVALGARSILRQQIDAAFAAAGIRPRVRLEVVHSATALAYVHLGAGVSIVDTFAAMGPEAADVDARPVAPTISLKFSAVYRGGAARSPQALAFSAILRDVLRQAVPASSRDR